MHPSWMCGLCGDSAFQCFSFLNYKMGHPFPSHKAIVEITGPTLPAPACLRFSLSEVFPPSFLPGQLLFILQKVWAQCHLLQEALPGHWFLHESLFGVGLSH